MSLGEIVEIAMELLDSLYTDNLFFLYSGELANFVIEETADLLEISLSTEDTDGHLYDAVSHSFDLLMISMHVPRQGIPTLDPVPDPVDERLRMLQRYVGDIQGTQEWHLFRREHLTASSIWKVLAGPASFNALVRAKCEPQDIRKMMSVNLDSTLHWGHRYEPVSVMLYEHDYSTKVGEFGCIPCSVTPFIAASPDGINIDPASPKYGRMLEVKNIVNRVITGVPKPEYWVQMQVQMAVCKLSICDFLETRFVELESYEAMIEQSKVARVGCMSLFLDGSGAPHYEYAPIGTTSAMLYESWNRESMNKNASRHWVKNIFWVLDEMLITEVRFNERWYQAAIPEFAACWEAVCAVRRGEQQVVPVRKRKQPGASSTTEEGSPKKFMCLV